MIILVGRGGETTRKSGKGGGGGGGGCDIVCVCVYVRARAHTCMQGNIRNRVR